MKLLPALCLSYVLFTNPVTAIRVEAGGTGAHGGDTVYCKYTRSAKYVGYYALDSLIAQISGGLEIANFENSDDAILRISQKLEDGAPFLAASLRTFVLTSMKAFDPSSERYWKKTAEGLVDIKDEKLLEFLPENCLGPKGKSTKGQDFTALQTVIRETTPTGGVVFRYVPKYMDQLASRGFEKSWILIHEWLWDFLDDSGQVRELNRYLHSVQFLSASTDQVRSALRNLGVTRKLCAQSDLIEGLRWVSELNDPATLKEALGTPCWEDKELKIDRLLLSAPACGEADDPIQARINFEYQRVIEKLYEFRSKVSCFKK